MTLSRRTSKNGLPLRWPICLESSTSMLRPSPVETPWIHASYIWTTARSSTSARSINHVPNPPIPNLPVARCPSVSENCIRHSQHLIVSILHGIAARVVAAPGHTGPGGTDGASRRYRTTRQRRECPSYGAAAGANVHLSDGCDGDRTSKTTGAILTAPSCGPRLWPHEEETTGCNNGHKPSNA